MCNCGSGGRGRRFKKPMSKVLNSLRQLEKAAAPVVEQPERKPKRKSTPKQTYVPAEKPLVLDVVVDDAIENGEAV